MITIERTHDMELVRSIITHPSIWSHVSDDSCDIASCAPDDQEAIYWLTPKDGDEMLGVYMVHPHNSICFEVHTCILPSARGQRAYAASKALLRWLAEHTPLQKLITHVPIFNRLAYRYALRAGMILEGVNRQSFLKDGQLHDQYLLGITRDEILCL